MAESQYPVFSLYFIFLDSLQFPLHLGIAASLYLASLTVNEMSCELCECVFLISLFNYVRLGLLDWYLGWDLLFRPTLDLFQSNLPASSIRR